MTQRDRDWQRAADAVRRYADVRTPAPDSWNVEAALARVHARANAGDAVPLYSKSRGRPRRIAILIAASILVTVGAGIAVRRGASSLTRGGNASGSTIGTALGERRTVRLADGTGVTLGPASRLSLGAAFASAARSVSLDGDAYFRVAHDSTRPFRIAAGRAVIQVIGTELAVRSYAEDSTTRVAVVTGRVAVGPLSSARSEQRPRVELASGDLATVTPVAGGRGDSIAVVSGADQSALLAWTHGELAFVDAPLRDVAGRLRRWYGVEVTMDSLLADRRVTASFTERPFAEVFSALCGAVRARCTVQGTSATMSDATR